ncbi:(2Fe-2S) ferredoxin domain-containing protein [Hydrogenispora ethanolica]|nr:(2Fe-2S) ferredoxin domain-containing protein [Hydrogenispora ethanolica]
MLVTICIGSGCHIKGSRQIIEVLQAKIQSHRLEAQIELEGCFCQGHCTEGVVLKIDGVMVTGVSKENIEALFNQRILEVLRP